jgi:hypothetical protein
MGQPKGFLRNAEPPEGWTQGKLADAAGLLLSTVVKFERSKAETLKVAIFSC